MTTRLPRGLRNNNPLNIEFRQENMWKGLDTPPHDGRFCRFTNIEYGVRAAALILRKYQQRGVDTVAEIVRTWAPPSENNVDAYVDTVCRHGGFSPHQKLDLRHPEVLVRLIRAMARHECGVDVDERTVRAGVMLAS